MDMETCIECTGPIPPTRQRHHAKFCTSECSRVYNRKRYAEHSTTLDLPTGTVGALAELVVAVDLMERGYDVFRALSQACGADLAVIAHGRLYRVEVRSGRRTLAGDGSVTYARPPRDDGRLDVYGVVLPKPREILYFASDGRTPFDFADAEGET